MEESALPFHNQETRDSSGRVWETNKIRLREAEATGAEILITACPLCLITLEDARKATGLKEGFRVMDLNELVLQALEGET